MNKVFAFFLASLLLFIPAAPAEETAERADALTEELLEEFGGGAKEDPEESDDGAEEDPELSDAFSEEYLEQTDDFSTAGEWYSDADGWPLRLILNTDGSYVFSAPDGNSEGVWEMEDSVILLDGAEAFPLEMIDGEALIQKDTGLLFTREASETYVPEEPASDAETGWFSGYWECAYVDVNGIPVPDWTVGDHTDVWIDGTLAALGGNRFGDVFWNFAFENGTLSATLDDGRTVTIAFQRDGFLRMTIVGQEGKTVLYLSPAWSETLDGSAEAE